MPGPVALMVPGAMAAAKRMAFEASTYLYTTEAAAAFTSAAFIAWLANWVWKRIPPWIKEDISFRNLIRSKKKPQEDASSLKKEELSHLASVLESLNRVTKYVEQLHNIPQLHAAILVYIQWSGQFKQAQLLGEVQESLTRDYLYRMAGPSIDLSHVQATEYQEALELAMYAYYCDTNDLRKHLQEREMELVDHDLSTRPGNVAYFVAVSAVRQELYIGIRGTSTLEDIVTDCCGHAVSLYQDEECGRIEVEAQKSNEVLDDLLEDLDEVEIISGHERIRVEDTDSHGENHIRCHEGILLSAQRMVKKIQLPVKTWAIDAKYKVVLCGHSLGGGAATLAALLLRSQFPDQLSDDRIRVYAFGPPPVLDHDSAIAASPFVTSIVHNADMIPRCSLYNLGILLEGLKCIHERLNEANMNPTGPKTTAAFVKHLSKGMEAQLLWTPAEWNETIVLGPTGGPHHIRKPAHLFVAGRVLLVYSPWADNNNRDEDDTIVEEECPKEVALRCVETNGAAAVLRTLEADGPRLFTDHVSASYFEALGMAYHFG